MAEQTLRIGIIGGGSIMRQRHMPGLKAIEGVEIVAVCNRHYQSTREFAEEFGIERRVDRWEDIVAMDDVDIVWIGTTPYMHCPIVLAALEAGKHVFCQSRMCLNLDEARQMAAAGAKHPDRHVRFCPPPMGMGGDRVMQRLLTDERVVGDIRQMFLSSANGMLLDPEFPLHWRLDKEQSGQNVLTVGIYLEVLDRWLGRTSAVTAVNRSWTPTRIHPYTRQATAAELPESVNIIAELANGAIGVYLFNAVSGHAPTDHLAVWGTKGTIVYDFNNDETQERIETGGIEGKGMEPVEIGEQERRAWTVEADFIRLVRTGEQGDSILPDLHAGVRYMTLIDAIHRSAAGGRRIEIPADNELERTG